MYMWDIWIMPLIFVVLLISFICIVAERKSRRSGKLLESRDEIGEAIAEHPFTLNPLVWVALVSVSFIFIIIIYYAASSSY